MNYEIRKNTTFNSNEIYFKSVPEKAVRENLKKLGFRYHGLLHCWYGYKSEDQIRKAIDGNTTTTTTNTETVNEYGVKVGDVFSMSWGWEQTQTQFFQVVAVTKKKARVIEVQPAYDSNPTGPMSETRTVTYKEGEKLPVVGYRSIWIDDQEKGDLKSIKDFSKDKTDPRIIISSRGCYLARKCHPGETFYESWYA